MALFPWEKHTLNPGPQNRGTDEGLPPRGSRWPVEPGRRSEKTTEDGGNLPDDDAETQSLGLELTVEEVVAGRIRLEDPRDDRPPSLKGTAEFQERMNAEVKRIRATYADRNPKHYTIKDAV